MHVSNMYLQVRKAVTGSLSPFKSKPQMSLRQDPPRKLLKSEKYSNIYRNQLHDFIKTLSLL